MDDAQFAELAAWIAEVGLAGESETAMVSGFCTRAIALGLPLARASVFIDTLHPIYEGRLFAWQASDMETRLSEYESSRDGEASERWRRSPFYRLVQSGEPLLRRRVSAGSEAEFPVLADMTAAGLTDYVAMVNRFAAEGIIGEMDCVYSSWATDVSQGFRDADVADLERLVPLLALAVKSASLARIARTLVETYLGRDAGRRVLGGRIARGVADRIDAVLWFSDLRGYTRITDTSAPGQIIPLLNDYADAIISAIHAEGGDVLKLMGDGTLAIFTAENREEACRAALAAASGARRSVAELKERRTAASLPVTDMYLGLHFGEVFYGNIGSKERLDFTVVGPAVNEVSRIAALCRSVEQPVLLSAAFALAVGEARRCLVSVGRFALRGVGRPQELFTLDPTQDFP
ncbi:MAG: adenylate/guanylate cyclase domain-containing protein [Alphaproteobacteria bacterium]